MKLLIFFSEAERAEHYARLIRERERDLIVETASSPEQARRSIGEAEILLGTRFPPGLFKDVPALRWIHKAGAGVEDIVYDSARPEGVRLTRADGRAIAPRMIEYVLGAIYFTTQHVDRSVRQQQRRLWETFPIEQAEGKTVGVAGLGDIGGAIAERLALNRMKVIGWRRSAGVPVAGVEEIFAGRDALIPFVSCCDFLVLVLPHTAATVGIISAEVFAAMRSHAVLINVGRGTVIDEVALASALASRRIGGAVLDVFTEEPLDPASPLWGFDSVLVTPHVSGPVDVELAVPQFLENLDRYRTGRPLLREVDLQRGY